MCVFSNDCKLRAMAIFAMIFSVINSFYFIVPFAPSKLTIDIIATGSLMNVMGGILGLVAVFTVSCKCGSTDGVDRQCAMYAAGLASVLHIGGLFLWVCIAYTLENINPDVIHATRAYSARDGLRALSWFSILWQFGSISTTAMLSLTAHMSLDRKGGAASEKVDVQLAVPVADASNNV